ncbi:MAG: ErfK/YbiS/YcfS/YnhG family protein [Bacteroidetes bacterium]|nr:ErfK/YbiS/YcfS/YnhG family protein [Bacteroidota bacterium]
MTRLRRYYLFILPAIFLCVTSCNKCAGDKQAVVLVDKPELVNQEVTKLLTEKLSDVDTSKSLVIDKDTLVAKKFLLDFYTKNKFAVSWTDKGKLTKQGDTLFSILKNADEFGLIAEDYHFSKIDQLLKTEQDSTTHKFDAVKLLNADLLLTDAIFKFTVHASKGRFNPDSLTLEWHPEKLDTDLVVLVNIAIHQNRLRQLINSLEPKNEQYQNLKLSLKNYKNEFKTVHWDSLASRESDSTTFTARLTKRLIASHDYFNDTTHNDSIKLFKSVKNFQCKHNLVEDGKIGKLTFKALQQTKEDVIHQIEMNMERWRWRDAPADKQYVWVNIPKFEMHVTEDDTLVMRSRVIIGEPEKQTPLLKSTITNFLIYPYWTVPFSIATKELLPILKRDTAYLRKKNFEVLDGNNMVVDPQTINWKRYSKTYFPWKLRQKTGDDNSLGILKFNFNNKYGVYMHDTDNHRLFGREMRALSHGCVRLEKFIDFASFLIRDDSVKYPKDSLMLDLLQEKQKYVYIKHPITIYINYYTVEADAYHELHFFNDVYERDEKMLKALYR